MRLEGQQGTQSWGDGEKEARTESTMSGTRWVLYWRVLIKYEHVWTKWMKRPSRLSCPCLNSSHCKSSHCTPALHAVSAPVPVQEFLSLQWPWPQLTRTQLEERHQIRPCCLTNGSWLHSRATFKTASSLESRPKSQCSHVTTHSQRERDQHRPEAFTIRVTDSGHSPEMNVYSHWKAPRGCWHADPSCKNWLG